MVFCLNLSISLTPIYIYICASDDNYCLLPVACSAAFSLDRLQLPEGIKLLLSPLPRKNTWRISASLSSQVWERTA